MEAVGNSLADRIKRGREAVARARADGADCSAWEQRLAQLEAEETASPHCWPAPDPGLVPVALRKA